MKVVKIIFQDCPFCGARKAWGERQKRIATRHHFKLEKVSFIAPEANTLMKKAVASGIRSMPFFTDGETFSKNLEDFIIKKPTPKRKKYTRKKKEEANGDNK